MDLMLRFAQYQMTVLKIPPTFSSGVTLPLKNFVSQTFGV